MTYCDLKCNCNSCEWRLPCAFKCSEVDELAKIVYEEFKQEWGIDKSWEGLANYERKNWRSRIEDCMIKISEQKSLERIKELWDKMKSVGEAQ